MIDTALTQIEAWHAAGLHLPVSVNIGARQLLHSDFVAGLRHLLAAHPGIRPGDLEMEVLETSALEDLDRVSTIIEHCQALGVQFALDDFGTGYSSLTYLKRLSVDQLKIGHSFVHDMHDDPDDLAIIEGVIGLAGAFRRQVIAEGVETVEHGAMLLQLGCELAQGYSIARPMPAAELPAWVAGWRPDPGWLGRQALNRQGLSILFACAAHRAWGAGIAAYLNRSRDTRPSLDVQGCQFGMWLNNEGNFLRGGFPFESMRTMHEEIHDLAKKLVDLHVSGKSDEALSRLPEMHSRCNDMIAMLMGVLEGGKFVKK